ncbi:MAG: hypothetical protein NTV93_20705 [Verrucomicrobia bacterium]|nr:hypothetical protein [Verrucomicrobiota bacterium]
MHQFEPAMEPGNTDRIVVQSDDQRCGGIQAGKECATAGDGFRRHRKSVLGVLVGAEITVHAQESPPFVAMQAGPLPIDREIFGIRDYGIVVASNEVKRHAMFPSQPVDQLLEPSVSFHTDIAIAKVAGMQDEIGAFAQTFPNHLFEKLFRAAAVATAIRRGIAGVEMRIGQPKKSTRLWNLVGKHLSELGCGAAWSVAATSNDRAIRGNLDMRGYFEIEIRMGRIFTASGSS